MLARLSAHHKLLQAFQSAGQHHAHSEWSKECQSRYNLAAVADELEGVV